MNAVVIASALSIILCSFNTNGIVFDNTPWRPGRDIDVVEKESLENERRLKNLATRIMSNGVEVLVKDKKPEAKNEQRKSKLIHENAMQPNMTSPSASKQLVSSAVATVVSRQQISAMFPLHQLMRHNYIIKTCMTTYTYLTTVVHNKRSAISTFETIVSVVTTESLTNLYATDIIPDLKPTKTKHFEVKTIQPSAATNMYVSVYPKIDKRIDNEEANFDLIQPSEVSSVSCTSSCPCSNTKTESLNTKFTNGSPVSKYGITSTKYGVAKIDLQPTNKETTDMKTKNQPYEYETNSKLAPTDKVVEKYTEVINDYSDEKDTNSVEQSELLTNEQAPAPIQSNKVNIKNPEKIKPDKPHKPNKNKFVVADLLKLGSLGIKGLSQLAPVIEKMTGGFIKRNDNFNKTTTTTIKPEIKLTAYSANKRIDNDFEAKHSNFPIYIPVDEMETSESQIYYSNATLHQNFAWAAEHKQPKAHIVLPKFIHESPLVNGGIPISPGEIITANSDVIVGKPAVGGPLTLAASGIKLHSSMNSPPIDSFVSGNEQYIVSEKPQGDQPLKHINMDQSYDLRPPEPPKSHSKGNKPMQRPGQSFNVQNIAPNDQYPYRMPPSKHDHLMNTEQIKSTTVLGNHGRPMFLDYIPSLAKPGSTSTQHHVSFKPLGESSTEIDVMDNSPSSSEVVNTQIKTVGEYAIGDNSASNKPFLVDIQPSRVANVLIPHGSSTALVFAGSSEPHKTGDYVDDPLPYPEPGYFGSFSIDAPQMTNVHNVVLNSNKQSIGKPNLHTVPPSYKPPISTHKDQLFRNELKNKWKDAKRPLDQNKIPPPTSNQETHLQVGPQITVYNPDTFNPNTNEFDSFNQVGGKLKIKDTKDMIDKEYENYLAVPPPPAPSKQYHNQDTHDKIKPYAQRPIVHTKPVQDMKVFLNIQHPIPEKIPPRVTSEIYFASQMPNSKPTPTYTIRMPQASYNKYNHSPSNNVLHSQSTQLVENTNPPIHNSFNIISSHASTNTSSIAHSNNDNSTYTVTLNTATNVASNNDVGQVIGSSIAVPISSSQNNAQFNADIPIGTNFAIRVEDNTAPPETFYLHQGSRNPAIVYNQHSNTLHSNTEAQILIGDNRWNKSSTNKPQMTDNKDSYYKKKYGDTVVHSVIQPMLPSINSHANFPMINDHTYTTAPNNIQEVKAVTESIDTNKSGETKRPAKLIPNIPTNSHGWYSSVYNHNNINNIKVEVTTRKVIPLNYDFSDNNQVPQFGQKIASIGKPPTEIWPQKVLSGINIGKPFTKPQSTERPHVSPGPLTTKPLKVNYVPSNFGILNQPAYDIPIRDNSDETTTHVTKTTTENIKPVYENSDVIYDGEEEVENPGDLDGEVSSESMKIPVVSTSNEVESVSTKSTELTLLQDEIYPPPSNGQKHVNDSKIIVEFNTGTQTEKPFRTFPNKTLQSNTMKPIYEHPSSNPYMKPRPFTINSAIVLDHQLHQPHWQINHMIENSTNVSYEDNIDLNIGEEIEKPSSAKPFSTIRPAYTTESVFKYKQPPRLVYKDRVNNTHVHNESIITSSVNIQDKKPLIVKNVTEKTTLPSITLPNVAYNHSSSEIIDLSPPPPTLDYNFKPSTNDEMIMGMSPPPPRTPSGIRLPTRLPITPRPAIPPRTLPPYRTKPPRLIPPRVTTQRPLRRPAGNDEVSTYRPAFDLLNGIRRPTYNRDQPSSLLLPPPREIPSRVSSPAQSIASVSVLDEPKIVFPTPISSGWLTSPASDYSSGFEVNFAPTSVQLPGSLQPSRIPASTENPSSESYYSYEDETSTERLDDKNMVSKEVTTQSTTSSSKTTPIEEINDSVQDQSYEWSSVEVPTTDKLNVISLGNKNRTRKPYPIRSEQKKNNTNRFKLPVKVPITPKPIKTLSRPDILYPTRPLPNKNILRPYPRPPTVIEPSMIESSEQSIDASYVNPTEVLKSSVTPTVSQVVTVGLEESVVSSIPTPKVEEIVKLEPTHHAGNEVKISDEIIPTKTEFRTTVVTLIKTLSEPPQTISSIGYVNLTHTLTVTHTKTSLVSQSEGAKTQTLVLTNTHTSTIVDVVTEVYTQVQPTTIIETVTKHIPIPQVQPTVVQGVVSKTKIPLDDVTMSSEESENFIIKDTATTANTIQKIEHEADNETDNDTFFVVMNKSQNGGPAPPVSTDIETGDYDVTRNEQVSNNGVSQVLFGEILLAGAPYLETTNVNGNGAYSKECQPDCKASRNERCQRIDGIMKCICRPGFARMFPDRPCKPTYTYSVKLALGTQGNESLVYNEHLSDNSSKQYHALAVATHEGINRMVMQSDLRDVYHGVHITGFNPVEIKSPNGDLYQGVMNDFYVQLSDNAHESRLKEVFEKYLRNNNYRLGGTEVHAAGELMDKLDVSDFDECLSGQFHDCSEHAQCFNLRGTYTCSCLEGFADLSVNTLYPGRICSAEPVGCERCNYHGACYSRDDRRVLCECFQWYSGSTCQINLKVVLISLVVCGALLSAVLAVCAVLACSRRSRTPPHPQRSIVACIQGMPSLHQGAVPKQRADRRALISERGESGDAASLQNASLPYIPAKQHRSSTSKKCVMSDPPAHDPPPPPAPAVMIPRARLLPHHGDSRENIARKRSLELSSEAKLISYLESGATATNDEMRRKHSLESSYSANKDRHNKQGALVSAGFKVSTTIRPDVEMMKSDRDDLSSVNKGDLDAELSRYDHLRKAYSQEDLSEWTDAERRLGELTLSEARSVGGTLPASTGRAASSTRLTHQEANTMAERDLGSTFLLPHVHLYKPDLTSDVSEFDSL